MWQTRQESIAEYRAQLSLLSANEVTRRVRRECESEAAQDRAQREVRTPPAVAPEAAFWIHREEWPVVSGALLLLNVEPRRGLGAVIRDVMTATHRKLVNPATYDSESEFLSIKESCTRLSDFAQGLVDDVHNIVTNVGAAARQQNLHVFSGNVVEPRKFLLWARDRGHTIPAPLAVLTQDVPSIGELQARIRQLETDRDNAWDQFEPNSSFYPRELDIAFQAWRAVCNESPASKGTPRQRLERWIRNGYPDLLTEEVERIAIVANFRKQRGKKKASNPGE